MQSAEHGHRIPDEDLMRAELWSRKLIIPIASGNLEAIITLLNNCLIEVMQERLEQFALDSPLASMPISQRTLNALENHLNVITLDDLLHCRREQLLATPTMNTTMLLSLYEAVLTALARHLPRKGK